MRKRRYQIEIYELDEDKGYMIIEDLTTNEIFYLMDSYEKLRKIRSNFLLIEAVEKLASADWMKLADKYFEKRKNEIINKVLKKKFGPYWKLIRKFLDI